MTNPPVKFLLVDDLEANLLALEGLLRRDGLELLKARSGAEALELLLVHDVALALLDVQMPGITGFELHKRLHTDGYRIPVIFMSGRREEALLEAAKTAGAIGFLEKPVNAHRLIDYLDEALKSRSSD